jgi:predicted aspartyl protease
VDYTYSKYYFCAFLLLLTLKVNAQFQILNQKRSVKLKFEVFNNLIILNGEINNQPKSFLLDTGVNKTVIFNSLSSRIDTTNIKEIRVMSLGNEKSVKAYLINATVNFKSFINPNTELYYITDKDWQLSNKLGVDIDGIIGYDFFKNHIVKIDYTRKIIKLYDPKKFRRQLRRYHKTSFQINAGKPYLEAQLTTDQNTHKNLDLLIDLGASGSFWLIETGSIQKPVINYFDILGYGLNQPIFGYRSKANSAKILGTNFKKPYYAFVPKSQINPASFKDGLVGAEILRRFKLFINYPENKLYTKPNKFIKDNFNYDKSGLILNYAGKTYTTVYRQKPYRNTQNLNKTAYGGLSNKKNTSSSFVSVDNIIIIANIRPNSPASQANLKIGDRILSINNKAVSKYNSQEINQLFSQDGNPEIKLKIQRKKKRLKVKFRLKSIFD